MANVLEGLTKRERTILDLIVSGSSSRKAATELGISPRTVEFHRANIMLKLAAKNIADLMRIVLTG
jgi:FixJ family two-component response regulator